MSNDTIINETEVFVIKGWLKEEALTALQSFDIHEVYKRYKDELLLGTMSHPFPLWLQNKRFVKINKLRTFHHSHYGSRVWNYLTNLRPPSQCAVKDVANETYNSHFIVSIGWSYDCTSLATSKVLKGHHSRDLGPPLRYLDVGSIIAYILSEPICALTSNYLSQKLYISHNALRTNVDAIKAKQAVDSIHNTVSIILILINFRFDVLTKEGAVSEGYDSFCLTYPHLAISLANFKHLTNLVNSYLDQYVGNDLKPLTNTISHLPEPLILST